MGLHPLLLIPLVLALTGCRAPPAPTATTATTATTAATKSPPLKTYARVADIERLDISIPGVLLVKPEHYLASYDQLMVDPIIVTFARGSAKLGRTDTKRLEIYLREATARELVNVDVSKIVSQPGPCVMRMQTAFLDVVLPLRDVPSDAHTTFIDSFGSVTLVHELRDSTTGTVLLRYMGRRRAPGGSAVGFVAPWSGLKRTFDRMLSDLQQSLVETVPLSTATKGPLARCNGLIYERIEES